MRGQPAPLGTDRLDLYLLHWRGSVPLDETVGAFDELKQWNLLPLCRRSGIPAMAYSPIEQGRLADDPVLQGIGRRRRATATQVAPARVVSHPGVCAIPEAGTPQHVRQNAAALRVELEEHDVVEIDAAFPPPVRPLPLEGL